jgi:hypothetical protein
MFAAHAFPMRLKLEIDEVVLVHIAHQDDIAPAASITPIGSAPGLVFLAAE